MIDDNFISNRFLSFDIPGHRLSNCREYFSWKIMERYALNYYILTEHDTYHAIWF